MIASPSFDPLLLLSRMMSDAMRDMSSEPPTTDVPLPAGRRKMHCKNVNFETTELTLFKHFSRYGSIIEVCSLCVMVSFLPFRSLGQCSVSCTFSHHHNRYHISW